MLKRYSLIGILLFLGIVLITAFYAKGENVPDDKHVDNPPENLFITRQQQLRDYNILLSREEKLHYIKRSLAQDNRPLSKEPVKVKGIYMSGAVFNSQLLFNNMLNIVKETEINALVIDIKDDMGYLTAELDIPLAKEIKARVHRGGDIQENMRILYESNIYPIARIVVFKDPTLADGKPEVAIKRNDGRLWRDRKGLAWVDPHNMEVWKYAVDVAKEAAKLGFREIQFDYVRFPTDGDVKSAIYPYATAQKKEDVIRDFLSYAKTELEEYNVFLAADVFGLTTLTQDDMGMGQKFEKIISQVDYVCPMIYPSHYGVGNYGFTNPNAHPYEVVKRAIQDGMKKAEGFPVVIRPWLQDFNLGSPRYGKEEVRAQIEATYDTGLEEWILWNAGNRYTKEALLPETQG